jgi:serine protease Do
VGINTAIASRNGGNMGVGFAIPIDMAKTVMQSLIGKGRVTRGWLGIGIQPLDQGLAKSFKYDSTQGALVGDVENGSPADKAGVEPGDIVTSYEGKPVTDPSELRNEVAGTKPGTKTELTVYRDGVEKKLTVKVGELNPQMLAAAGGSREMSDELGMTVENLSPQMAKELGYTGDHGVVVTSVEPDGLAAQAGIQPNDLILSVQDKPLANVAQFETELGRHNLKDGVRIAVRSGTMQRYVYLEDHQG